MTFGPYSYISGRDPLFVHQYSHAWFDFAGKRDAYTNYFSNSITATRAHKAFCLGLKRGYTDDYWGVSASDWQHGYTAWGGPPLMGPVDGSVVPYAAAGSLPFLPRECVRVLRALRDNFGADAWGRYGFCDAFHPELHWYDPDVLGIDPRHQRPHGRKPPHRLRLGHLHAEPRASRRHEGLRLPQQPPGQSPSRKCSSGLQPKSAARRPQHQPPPAHVAPPRPPPQRLVLHTTYRRKDNSPYQATEA